MLAWLAAGFALFAGFLLWERIARAPMVKLELFRSRAFAGANVYTLVLFFAFNAMLFFLPMTLVSAWSRPEWQASLVMVPLSLAIATFSGRAGRLADRIGPRLLLPRRRADGGVLCRPGADHAADAPVGGDGADPDAQRRRHGDAGVAAVGGPSWRRPTPIPGSPPASTTRWRGRRA